MQKLAYTQITTEKFAYFPVFERKIKMERIMYIYIIRSIQTVDKLLNWECCLQFLFYTHCINYSGSDSNDEKTID